VRRILLVLSVAALVAATMVASASQPWLKSKRHHLIVIIVWARRAMFTLVVLMRNTLKRITKKRLHLHPHVLATRLKAT
jgi:hypothetical protein